MADSPVIGGRVRAVVIALALLGAAVVLALVVPAVQQVPLSRRCSELGGALVQSTEKVEPLVVGRTVFRCVGPGGQVLRSW